MPTDLPAAGTELATTYLQKRDAIDAADPSAHMELAAWCESKQLFPQAAEHYRRVLELKPDHLSAYDRLVYAAEQYVLPEDAARRESLQREFGEDFKLHATRHFVVVYNAEENWSRQRAALLERTHDVYYKTLRRLGYQPLPLTERLVCVLFTDYTSYHAYVRRSDGGVMEWAAGYYSTRNNRTAFYHDRDNPEYDQIRQRMEALEQIVEQLSAQLRQSIARNNHALSQETRRQLTAARKEQNWYRNRIKAVAHLANALKTVHEATHQLAFNSGLQQRGKMYPFWFSEGLATNFETNNPNEPFGPMHDNLGRRKVLTDALAAGRLAPLEQFITDPPPKSNRNGEVSVAYAQAWGLFRFLLRYRKDQMRRYLDTLHSAPLGRRDRPTLRREFTDAFGPIDQVQKLWDRHLATVRRPVNITTDVFNP